jgi:hypothetical protein
MTWKLNELIKNSKIKNSLRQSTGEFLNFKKLFLADKPNNKRNDKKEDADNKQSKPCTEM